MDSAINVKNRNTTEDNEWISSLRESPHGSLYIRITNLLSEPLELLSDDVEGSQSGRGHWVKFLKKSIPSGCCVEAGIQCTSPFSSCCESFIYRSSIHIEYSLTLSWEYGAFVCRAWVNKLSFPGIAAPRHIRGGYNSSIHFCILNPLHLPKLELVSAWIVADNIVEDESFSFLFADDALNLKNKLPDSRLVTKELIRFIQRGDAAIGEDTITPGKENRDPSLYCSEEFNLPRPCEFLEFLLQQISIPDSLTRGALHEKYQLLLNWRIGCERNFHSWKFGEPIHLYSGFPGCISDPSIAMSCIVSHRKGWGCSNADFVKESPLRDTFSSADSLERNEVIRRAVRCMQCLSYGLNSVISHLMSEKYGLNWFRTVCKIPKCHIWQESKSKQRLDLEGILFIIIARWEDIFEQVFSSAGLSFSDLKESYCVYWSSQELNKFNELSVKAFEHRCITILKSLKEFKYVKEIKNEA